MWHATCAQEPRGPRAIRLVCVGFALLLLVIGPGASAAADTKTVPYPDFKTTVNQNKANQAAAVQGVLSSLSKLTAAEASRIPTVVVSNGQRDVTATVAAASGQTVVTMTCSISTMRAYLSAADPVIHITVTKPNSDKVVLEFFVTDSWMSVDGYRFSWSRSGATIGVSSPGGTPTFVSARLNTMTLDQLVDQRIAGDSVWGSLSTFGKENGKVLPTKGMRNAFKNFVIWRGDVEKMLAYLVAVAREAPSTTIVTMAEPRRVD